MEKINVAELLKDCPKGMELDCILFNNPVKYTGLDNDDIYPIEILTKNNDHLYLTQEGYLYNMPNSKCIIFPKGKTTWEGFVTPCKFKDGDIITCTNSACSFVAIFKEMDTDTTFRRYVSLTLDDVQQFWTKESWSDFCSPRLATEEEKQKLFKAIKDNGYKWNYETKTFVKLIEPKFKVGDKVRHKNNHNVVFTITSIEEDYYACGAKAAFWFDDQDDYELVPNKFDITTLKPFESRVLVRDSEMGIWLPDFFGCLDNSNECPYMVVGGIRWKCCIPYEGNEHLMGKADDCDDFYKNW